MALQNDHTSKMDLSCWCCFKKFQFNFILFFTLYIVLPREGGDRCFFAAQNALCKQNPPVFNFQFHCQAGVESAHRPVGPSLQIFGLITLALVIKFITTTHNLIMGCWGEVRSLRAQSIGEVSVYQSCMQFSGYVEMKFSQAYNQLKSWLRQEQHAL